MNIQYKTIVHTIGHIGSFLKMHVSSVLFLLFFISLGVWGFIFWHYGYAVVFTESEIAVKPLTIKENELQNIIEKQKKREELSKSITEKTFKDPFIVIIKE